MTPGVHYGVDNAEYHGSDGISKTGLDAVERSPAIYYALHLDPSRPPPKERAGQLEGSLAHCAVLEPHQFDARYSVHPVMHRGTKAWKEIIANNPRTPIQADQYEAACRQAESVRKLPEVRDLLAKGAAEVSACWRDAQTGEMCRCRPDFVHDVSDSAVIVADLKTFSTGDPREFARQCARKRWHVQSALYTDGFAIASGREVLAFVFVLVASEHPWDASACMLDEEGMEAGRRAYRRNLDTYAQCRRTGVWPGYGEGIHLINLPQWATQEN